MIKIVCREKGIPAKITNDNRLSVVAVTQTDLNALAGEGSAWTLPFVQNAAANTTDNVVFHFKNTSGDAFDFMRLLVSSKDPGRWTIETGRTYSAGGTAITLRQLNSASGKTQDMTAYYGTGITLAGTASDIMYVRTAADETIDLLDYGPIVVEQSDTLAIKFKADTGSLEMAVTPIIHGSNPWE